MASPTLNDDTCYRVDVLERVLSQEAMTCHSVEDPLEAALIGCHMTGSHSGKKEEYARLLNISTTYTPRHSLGEVLNVEELTSKEKEKSPPKVELKPLPSHLRYEFLDCDHKFSIIVSAKLEGPQLEKLLDVLRKHRGASVYSIDDIKGFSLSLCMHRIVLHEGHRPSKQPQCRLNPNMQEAVKKEVVKLLDAAIIYPIYSSE